MLKRIAVKLSKICNDLRLLSSGPRAGFNEINLPPVQAGSSIMPGKINPVIPEVVNQVAFEVIGNDVTVTMAAEAGQLQLNAFEPIILHSLGESITHLTAACRVLADRCVKGITANPDVTRGYVENSIGLATALNPAIGYAAATEIAKEALATGRGVAELVLEPEADPGRTPRGDAAPGEPGAPTGLTGQGALRDIGADAPGRAATNCGRSGGGSAAAASPAAAPGSSQAPGGQVQRQPSPCRVHVAAEQGAEPVEADVGGGTAEPVAGLLGWPRGRWGGR